MSPNLQSSFWARMGLNEDDRDVSLQALQELYLGYILEAFGNQGYCSFTLQVSRPEYMSSSGNSDGSTSPGFITDVEGTNTFIVQIRPEQHSLDLSIACAALQTYTSLTPRVRALDCHLPGQLRAVEMDMIPGVPFSRLQPQTPDLVPITWTKQVAIIQSFAAFLARAWPSPSNDSRITRNILADSSTTNNPTLLSACAGTVGVNIIPKLTKLSLELPDPLLCQRAAVILEQVTELKDYPVVLNHGDLIPSNLLVDEHTWEVTGVIDWAEAEWLPFGTCLYGLEFLLGYLDYSSPTTSSLSLPTSIEVGYCQKPVWRYYTDAARLRGIFWEKLYQEAPGIRKKEAEIMLARDMGVLLWFGYAWDEGAIDRVVNEEQDAVEIKCLRAFLGI
jgi:hypothetical protein